MASIRRRTPEPPAGLPQVQFRPGLANETLHELAPLLAEEGIDVDNIDVPDLDTLQQAMNRAVERHNMMRFTPVGAARDDALDVLREVSVALATDDPGYAGDVLDSVPPDAPDDDCATVAGCIGVALGLLDEWLSGRSPNTPAALPPQVVLPAGHWTGERAGADILALARKGRAFGSIDSLIVRQGGKQVLYGAALAVAAAMQTWSRMTGRPIRPLARTHIR
jgi:hypothetical protein